LFKEIVDSYDWKFCQIQYNFMDERNQAGTEGLGYAAERGLGIVVMEPLRGGMLSKDIPSIRQIRDRAEVSRSPSEWALDWVWNHPEVSVVLSGMSTLQQVKENVAYADGGLPGSLSPEDLALFEEVKAEYQKRIAIPCTGCRYCVPCPSGVNIPACFEAYNNIYLGNPMMAKVNYLIQVGGGLDGSSPRGFASQCKSCNKCVKVCTQHIDIPAKLKDASRELESPSAKAMFFVMRPGMSAFMRFERWRNLRKARA
jgi:predicted aldo/keto reductase-like oxidoreductase